MEHSMAEPRNYKIEFYATCIITLIVLLITWVLLKTSLKLKPFGKRIDKIPGPYSVPIFGTLALIFIPRTEILEALVRWGNKFKGCFKVWVLNDPMIFISSGDHVQKILSSKEHVDKSEIYGVVKHLIGSGLITADVASWRAHRKLLLTSVNGKMVDIFMDVCNEYLNVFQEVMSKELDSNKATQLPTNLHPLINRLAFDIICETIFGKSEDTLKNASTQYLEASFKNKVVCSKRWFTPWLRWNWLWKIHPLRKYERDVVQVADKLFSTVIGDRRQFRKEMLQSNEKYDTNANGVSLEKCNFKLNKRAGRGALIDTLLDAAEDPANEITDEYMKYELMTFLVAGHDTSAETILWVLFMLGNHPEIQEKVHGELRAIFGDNKQPNITMDDLSRMTYLDQCIKETLRMYPSVPLFMRKVHTDIELEPGLVIPSGTDVGICVPAVHQDPIVYPNPKQFDPERFTQENITKRHPYVYCPFSLGPRNCIGKRLGEVLTKTVLTNFFLNFSIVSLQKQEEIKTVAEVTLGPSKAIYFKVQRR